MSKKSFLPFLILAYVATLSTIVSGGAYLFRQPRSQATYIPSVVIPSLTPSSEKVELTGELIPDFPILPIYENATLVNSYKKTEGQRVGFEANWITSDPVNIVMNWYMQQVQNDGWIVIESPENPDADSEQFAVLEKDGRSLHLTVEQETLTETEIHAEFPLADAL